MELYAERGFDRVTVDEIAERAGLTARTFFRHFADKREVLFFGAGAVLEALEQTLNKADPARPPLDVVADALRMAATMVGSDHEHSVLRWSIIQANTELQERELMKLSGWSQVIAERLHGRGVDVDRARLAADIGVAVFRVAFEKWVTTAPTRSLDQTVTASFDQLHTMAAG